ncbi:MAG: hypothetical protein ACOYOU_03250 [Kiritimatiellia bacterium]
MTEVGSTIDGLSRLIRDAEDEDSVPPEITELAACLGSARDSYYASYKLWQIKMKFPEQDSSSEDAEMHNHWSKAADFLDKADAAGARLQKLKP